MLVVLPRSVTGRELYEVIYQAAKEIEADGYKIHIYNEEYRLEPGSVKRVLHRFSAHVNGPILRLSDNRIVRSMQKIFVRPVYFSFGEIIKTDKTYDKLDITAGKDVEWALLTLFVPLEGNDLEQVQPTFEKFVQAIYHQLGTNPQTA